MIKEEFIEFLKTESEKRGFGNKWAQLLTSSDDFWRKFIPGVDRLEDDMDLSQDGKVIIKYNKSLYSKDKEKIFETTYEDFVQNYQRSLQ